MPLTLGTLLPGPVFAGAYGGTATERSPRLWFYSTPDNRTTVLASGYFNGATHLLNRGDIIAAHVETGGTPGFMFAMVTSASQAGTVTTLQNYLA
jgi:hypothetical protein